MGFPGSISLADVRTNPPPISCQVCSGSGGCSALPTAAFSAPPCGPSPAPGGRIEHMESQSYVETKHLPAAPNHPRQSTLNTCGFFRVSEKAIMRHCSFLATVLVLAISKVPFFLTFSPLPCLFQVGTPAGPLAHRYTRAVSLPSVGPSSPPPKSSPSPGVSPGTSGLLPPPPLCVPPPLPLPCLPSSLYLSFPPF